MTDPTSATHVYKILTPAQWQDAERAGVTAVPLDVADGFVHLSTADQVIGTLARHFGAHDALVLVRFAVTDLPPLQWEAARDGHLFPHLYAPLELARADRTIELRRGADGAWPQPREGVI
jgi:uncharacterized protein (DUF952 family)